jgi:hypothetical protein
MRADTFYGRQINYIYRTLSFLSGGVSNGILDEGIPPATAVPQKLESHENEAASR